MVIYSTLNLFNRKYFYVKQKQFFFKFGFEFWIFIVRILSSVGTWKLQFSINNNPKTHLNSPWKSLKKIYFGSQVWSDHSGLIEKAVAIKWEVCKFFRKYFLRLLRYMIAPKYSCIFLQMFLYRMPTIFRLFLVQLRSTEVQTARWQYFPTFASGKIRYF